jgi:hypothetical protein
VVVARMFEQLRAANRRAELLPDLVPSDGDGDVLRLGVKRLVGHQHGIRGAQRTWHHSVGEVVRQGGAEERNLTFEHRDVDELTLLGLLLDSEREQDRVCRIYPACEVGNRNPAARAGGPGLAGDADHAALSLHDVVRIDPKTMQVTQLINQPDTDIFCCSTDASPIGNELWIGSFRSDRIAVFPLPK